jgi:hypothetical protein
MVANSHCADEFLLKEKMLHQCTVVASRLCYSELLQESGIYRILDMLIEKNNMTSKEQVDKKDFWQHELKSLGLEQKQNNELNDKEELQHLTDTIKQSMYQDYKTAYGKDGDKHEEEAESTIKV